LGTDWRPKLGDKFVRRPRAKAHPLRRALGVFGLFSAGYGNVGSSIYYALGLVALIAFGATPVVLLIAGIFFIFTALSYAEGTAMMPEAGGSASFARHGFNDLFASVAGWALAFSYIVTIAISAYTAPAYLGYFWQPLKASTLPWGTGLAMGIVFFLMCLNVIGVKESSILNIFFALLDVITQIIIILLAILLIFAPHPEIFSHNVIGNWPSASGLILGIAIAAIAYTGVETISQLSEEARRPTITAPRAMILMIVVVMLLFSGISVAAFSTMTPIEMASQWARDPIAGIADGLSIAIVPEEIAAGLSSSPAGIIVITAFLGGIIKLLPILVAVLATTILIIATNAGLMGISRLTFSLGRFQLIPLTLSKIHHKFRTPYKSIILFSLVAILLLIPGFFAESFPKFFVILGGLYVFGSLLAFSLAHASILRLRIKHPELPRPFKLRGNIKFKGWRLPITAIIGLVATSAIWLAVVITQPYARWVGFGWMAFGLMFYLAFRYRKRLPLIHSAQEVKLPVD
jgi:APA family basic amino acid/polyamine antiporter